MADPSILSLNSDGGHLSRSSLSSVRSVPAGSAVSVLKEAARVLQIGGSVTGTGGGVDADVSGGDLARAIIDAVRGRVKARSQMASAGLSSTLDAAHHYESQHPEAQLGSKFGMRTAAADVSAAPVFSSSATSSFDPSLTRSMARTTVEKMLEAEATSIPSTSPHLSAAATQLSIPGLEAAEAARAARVALEEQAGSVMARAQDLFEQIAGLAKHIREGTYSIGTTGADAKPQLADLEPAVIAAMAQDETAADLGLGHVTSPLPKTEPVTSPGGTARSAVRDVSASANQGSHTLATAVSRAAEALAAHAEAAGDRVMALGAMAIAQGTQAALTVQSAQRSIAAGMVAYGARSVSFVAARLVEEQQGVDPAKATARGATAVAKAAAQLARSHAREQPAVSRAALAIHAAATREANKPVGLRSPVPASAGRPGLLSPFRPLPLQAALAAAAAPSPAVSALVPARVVYHVKQPGPQHTSGGRGRSTHASTRSPSLSRQQDLGPVAVIPAASVPDKTPTSSASFTMLLSPTSPLVSGLESGFSVGQGIREGEEVQDVGVNQGEAFAFGAERGVRPAAARIRLALPNLTPSSSAGGRHAAAAPPATIEVSEDLFTALVAQAAQKVIEEQRGEEGWGDGSGDVEAHAGDTLRRTGSYFIPGRSLSPRRSAHVHFQLQDPGSGRRQSGAGAGLLSPQLTDRGRTILADDDEDDEDALFARRRRYMLLHAPAPAPSQAVVQQSHPRERAEREGARAVGRGLDSTRTLSRASSHASITSTGSRANSEQPVRAQHRSHAGMHKRPAPPPVTVSFSSVSALPGHDARSLVKARLMRANAFKSNKFELLKKNPVFERAERGRDVKAAQAQVQTQSRAMGDAHPSPGAMDLGSSSSPSLHDSQVLGAMARRLEALMGVGHPSRQALSSRIQPSASRSDVYAMRGILPLSAEVMSEIDTLGGAAAVMLAAQGTLVIPNDSDDKHTEESVAAALAAISSILGPPPTIPATPQR